MNSFINGFEKQAANVFTSLGDKIKKNLTAPSHKLKTYTGMVLAGATGVGYAGAKTLDKAIGIPTPQKEW